MCSVVEDEAFPVGGNTVADQGDQVFGLDGLRGQLFVLRELPDPFDLDAEWRGRAGCDGAEPMAQGSALYWREARFTCVFVEPVGERKVTDVKSAAALTVEGKSVNRLVKFFASTAAMVADGAGGAFRCHGDRSVRDEETRKQRALVGCFRVQREGSWLPCMVSARKPGPSGRLDESDSRCRSSANMIESIYSVVRQVCRNVKRWRNARMALRWTGAGLLEAKKGLRRLKAHRQLPILKASLTAHRAKSRAALDHLGKGGLMITPQRQCRLFQYRTRHPSEDSDSWKMVLTRSRRSDDGFLW